MRSKETLASLINITLHSQFGILLTTLSSGTASTITIVINAIFTVTMIPANCTNSTLITTIFTTSSTASILVLLNKLLYTLRYTVAWNTKITKRNSYLGSSRTSVSLSTIQTTESLKKKRDKQRWRPQSGCSMHLYCWSIVDLKSGRLGLDSLCVPWSRADRVFLGSRELPVGKDTNFISQLWFTFYITIITLSWQLTCGPEGPRSPGRPGLPDSPWMKERRTKSQPLT